MQDPRKQRPAPADLGLLADESTALLQPRLEDTGLVWPTASWRRALVHEDQLAFCVDVLRAQREQFLWADPCEEWREDQRPVARIDSVEQATGVLGRNPAALLALARGLQPGVGRIDARTQRRVDVDAVLAQGVAEHGREAADRPVDRRFR
jgi:hypothetical protein